MGKRKRVNRSHLFQRNSEYSILSEVIKGDVEKNNRPEIMALSARLSSDTQIEGTIKFDGIMRIDGKIIASDKAVLKQKAHFIGDLQAKTLVIEEGVVFVWRCNVNPEGVKIDTAAKKNQPKTHHIQQKNISTGEANTAKSVK